MSQRRALTVKYRIYLAPGVPVCLHCGQLAPDGGALLHEMRLHAAPGCVGPGPSIPRPVPMAGAPTSPASTAPSPPPLFSQPPTGTIPPGAPNSVRRHPRIPLRRRYPPRSWHGSRLPRTGSTVSGAGPSSPAPRSTAPYASNRRGPETRGPARVDGPRRWSGSPANGSPTCSPWRSWSRVDGGTRSPTDMSNSPERSAPGTTSGSPVEYRELYCRGCSAYWVEGRTVRTRLRGTGRVRTCLACGRSRRHAHFVGSDRPTRSGGVRVGHPEGR